MSDKYNNSKTLKFSNKNINKLDFIVKKKKFKNDSEANRYCIDVVYALIKENLEAQATAKIFEDME